MKKEKITLIKPKKVKEKKLLNAEIIKIVLSLLIGIILLTNSSNAVIFVCYCLGSILLTFGIFQLLSYYRLKKELNVENNSKMILGTITIFSGLLIIILSSTLETFLRFIIGLVLIYNGLKKVIISLNNNNSFNLAIGISFIAMGLYTIFAENIIFQIVGILLIISAILDIITYLKNK